MSSLPLVEVKSCKTKIEELKVGLQSASASQDVEKLAETAQAIRQQLAEIFDGVKQIHELAKVFENAVLTMGLDFRPEKFIIFAGVIAPLWLLLFCFNIVRDIVFSEFFTWRNITVFSHASEVNFVLARNGTNEITYFSTNYGIPRLFIVVQLVQD